MFGDCSAEIVVFEAALAWINIICGSAESSLKLTDPPGAAGRSGRE
jgi:hypothetical protein